MRAEAGWAEGTAMPGGTQQGSTCGWGRWGQIQPVQSSCEGKGLFSPFCLSSNALQGKSNFIMAGAFRCQRQMKESYLKAKSRLAPDIVVAAAEWRMDTFHLWKRLHKEQDRSGLGPQGGEKKLSAYKPEVLCLGWDLGPVKDCRVGTWGDCPLLA